MTANNVWNHMQKHLFIGGLRENLRAEVLKISTATLIETLMQASKAKLIHNKQMHKIFAVEDLVQQHETQNDKELDTDEIMAINCWRAKCGKWPITKTPTGIKCYKCNKMGHMSRDCRAPRRRQFQEHKDNWGNNQRTGKHRRPILHPVPEQHQWRS